MGLDWIRIANMDWEFYHDPTRIAVYVAKGKITPEDYEDITGEPYTNE